MEENKNEEKLETGLPFAVKFINPDEIVSSLDIEKGMTVADFGCGAGFFSIAIAKKISETGLIYALDILPQKLESVESQARALGLTNIVAKRANLEKEKGSGLADGSCDWVILKDILFQNKDKTAVLKEAKRVLKDKGKALLIEWKINDSSFGPENGSRISEEAVVSIVQESGLGVLKKIKVGNFHYGLILIK